MKCSACRRELKHDSPTGMGPVCARKRGLAPSTRPATEINPDQASLFPTIEGEKNVIAEFLYLPSSAQPRNDDGSPAKPRLFLTDGSELVGISSVTVYRDEEVVAMHSDGRVEYSRPSRPRRVEIEFNDATFTLVNEAPKKTATREA